MDSDQMEYLLDKIKELLVVFPPELQEKFADHVIDFVENYMAGSQSSLDDMLVLPICNGIRSHFNIPDGDD